MYRFLVQDERGAITIDWVTLTAGIAALGILVVYLVLEHSADNLFDEFDTLNTRYSETATELVQVIQNTKPGQNTPGQ